MVWCRRFDMRAMAQSWTRNTVLYVINAALRNVGPRLCGPLIMRLHYLGGSLVRRGPQ